MSIFRKNDAKPLELGGYHRSPHFKTTPTNTHDAGDFRKCCLLWCAVAIFRSRAEWQAVCRQKPAVPAHAQQQEAGLDTCYNKLRYFSKNWFAILYSLSSWLWWSFLLYCGWTCLGQADRKGMHSEPSADSADLVKLICNKHEYHESWVKWWGRCSLYHCWKGCASGHPQISQIKTCWKHLGSLGLFHQTMPEIRMHIYIYININTNHPVAGCKPPKKTYIQESKSWTHC